MIGYFMGDEAQALRQYVINSIQSCRQYVINYVQSWRNISRYSVWELVMVGVVLYVTLLAPVQLFFLLEVVPTFLIPDLLVHALIIIDIVGRFQNEDYIAYLNRDRRFLVKESIPRETERDPRVYDVIFEIISLISLSVCFCKSLKCIIAYGVFNMFRLRRIARFSELYDRWENDINSNYFCARLTKLIMIAVVGAHYGACLLYFVAACLKGDHKMNWMKKYDSNLPLRSKWVQYVYAVYWSVTVMTTTGFGDINPSSIAEVFVILAFMFFNLGLGAYVVGNLNCLFSGTTDKIQQFRLSIESVKRFAHRHKLPPRLKNELLLHMLSEFQREVETKALNSVSKPILSQMSHDLFFCVPAKYLYLFTEVSPDFCSYLAYSMRVETFGPKDTIIFHKQVPDKLYIVVTGAENLEAFSEDEPGVRMLTDDLKGVRIFGEIGLICNVLQPFGVQAVGYAQLLSMDHSTFRKVVADKGDDMKQVLKNLIEHMRDSPRENTVLVEMEKEARRMEKRPGGNNLLLKYLFEEAKIA